MSQMDRFAGTNERYVRLCRRFGIILHIEAEGEPLPAPKCEHYTLRLKLDLIPEGQYETYLSYNVRKLLLPLLNIDTGRLIVRRVEMADAEALFESFADAESARLDTGSEPFETMEGEYMDGFAAMVSDETRYSIVSKDTGKAVGLVNLTPKTDRQVETMEIGYCINPSSQRRGYAYEAVSALLDFLQKDLFLDLVLANCVELNTPSQNMLKKLGF
ncbi:MAG: GNAT family N-acetyltransferase, partial [Clostridia bacterium]|nr:GNAT family N-acetyltransferase [Clostridia bacterium]